VRRARAKILEQYVDDRDKTRLCARRHLYGYANGLYAATGPASRCRPHQPSKHSGRNWKRGTSTGSMRRSVLLDGSTWRLTGRESLAWFLENLHKSPVFRQVAQLPTFTTRLAVAGAFVDSPPLSGFASAMTLAMTLDANDSGTSSGKDLRSAPRRAPTGEDHAHRVEADVMIQS
jgi:hypothetical protein